MSRRALLIAVGYYPLNMAGAHRPAKMAKYLPAFGWEPVVLCAQWTPENSEDSYDPVLAAQADVCPTVRVPYPTCPATKIGRGWWYGSQMLFPYRAPFLFTRRMLAAARKLAAREHFDGVWSTANPPLVHCVANRISREFGIPWVADFRDIPDVDFSPWQLRLTTRQEIRTCRPAAALTTVGQALADTLAGRHAAPVYVVHNGFDPDDYQADVAVNRRTFTICYTGVIYPLTQDPRLVFEALDRLSAASQMDLGEVRVEFYGSLPQVVASFSQGFQSARVVVCHDRIPHLEVTRRQQEASVLLLLSSPSMRGMMTSKIFGYLAAGRPILDVPGGDATGPVMQETGAGVCAATADEVAKVLLGWYREWKQTGTVACRGAADKIAVYSRKHQAGQLAQVFEAIGRRPPGT